MAKEKFRGVSAVETSQNRKVGIVSATYIAQESCPDTCPWRGSGCYAEVGHTGCQTHRLNAESAAAGMTAETLALEEARAIDTLSGRFDLRLHVVGDCQTDTAAQAVSAAARRYRARHGRAVWSYTHAWRTVDRASWAGVSVLASCDTPADLADARARGYASALVVPDPHAGRQAYPIPGTDMIGIPCPQQTGAADTCTDCRLCWHDERLLASRRVILFAPDGHTRGRITTAMRERVAQRTVAVRLPMAP